MHPLISFMLLAATCICVSSRTLPPKSVPSSHVRKQSRKRFKDDFLLQPLELMRGVTYYGTTTRLRRAFAEVAAGRKIVVTVVGGSISVGAGAHQDGTPFYERAEQWTDKNFPGLIQWKNGAIGATTTTYMSICVQKHVPLDSDIVVFEYALNNRSPTREEFNLETTRSMERLIRKLLDYPKKPAILLLNAYTYDLAWPTKGAFWGGSVERDTAELAAYYDLPSLSVKASSHHLMVNNVSGYRVDRHVHDLPKNSTAAEKQQFFYYDEVHPYGPTGHRVMSDLLVYMFKFAYTSVSSRPWSPVAELPYATGPLPQPIIPGNVEGAASARCFTDQELEQITVSTKGFKLIDESRVKAKHKWGYVSQTVGGSLLLAVNTVPAATSTEGDKVTVQIGYLSSYQHMGTAEVSCVAGCKCDKTTFNGHTKITASQMAIHTFAATPHPECHVQIRVIDDTDSGEHKVKVVGVMVAEEMGGRKIPWHRSAWQAARRL